MPDYLGHCPTSSDKFGELHACNSSEILVYLPTMPDSPAELYDQSIGDAARILGFHPDTIRKWATSGDLQGILTPGVRGRWRFRRSDLDAFLVGRASRQGASA